MSFRRCGFRHERRLRALGIGRIAGIDEAGRGALAGPVVAAAVILPEKFRHRKLTSPGFRPFSLVPAPRPGRLEALPYFVSAKTASLHKPSFPVWASRSA